MAITGIDSVIYGVADLPECIRFWEDFGLVKQAVSETGATFGTAEGSTVILRPMDDPNLPAAVVDGPTMREVIWGVDTKDALDSLAADLSRDLPVEAGADGAIHTHDAEGYPIGFRVSSVTPMAYEHTQYNGAGFHDRVDRRAVFYDKAEPRHLAHVVFRAPNLEAMKDFYVERLGFRITDVYRDRGYFLRCEGSIDHHHLFAFNPDGTKGFHHISFEVRDFHEVFGGGLNMTKQGWETHLGPGRHAVTSAYFWYFRNPCGGAAEYDFDTDVCTDDWEVVVFDPTPDSFAEWSMADGMERYTGIQKAKA